MVEVDEPVSVVASFASGRIRPLSFRWNSRLIQVKEITYRWTQQDGEKELLLFAVTDGKCLYNLSFSPRETTWRLLSVETEL